MELKILYFLKHSKTVSSGESIQITDKEETVIEFDSPVNSLIVYSFGDDFTIQLNNEDTKHLVTQMMPFSLDSMRISKFKIIGTGKSYYYRAAQY